MATWITDSLTNAIGFAARLNPFARQNAATAFPGIFGHQLAVAAYMGSGMLRKVITIPAADRTQKWRDWQTDKDTIALIEAEEKRLGLRAKTKHAEILRGIGGCAMILVTTGQHDQQLTPDQISRGELVAINVVSRWEIEPIDFDTEMASPTFRQPRMFKVSGDKRIHPSRVICFRGDPLPAGAAVADVEAFWGDCRLLRVWREVENSDHAQQWFVELVKKAKLLRIGIPDLLDMVATSEGRDKLNQRIALIATGESSLNATVYRSGTGADDPGEKLDDYQINWTGIPAFMDALDQRVAAVADIPFTRLMGRSPAGMNATGQHDTDNWNDAVSDGQESETRPCLEQLDPLLLRSAGVTKLDDVTWRWAPLWTPTEKEEADTFKTAMEAIEKAQNTGAIPERAFAEAFQNWLEEREYLPGLGAALANLSEEERFGLQSDPNPDPNQPDPSALQAKGGDPSRSAGGAGGGGSVPARRAANDMRFTDGAEPKTLYVQRKLLNAAEVIRWAKSQGLETTLAADDMHVTVAHSRTPVDWFSVGTDWSGDEKGNIRVKPGGPRAVERLGDGEAVALIFASDDLKWRHDRIREAGASWDWPDYRPHVTLSWDAPGVDVSTIEPYTGPLVFGPELFSEVREDWRSTIEEG